MKKQAQEVPLLDLGTIDSPGGSPTKTPEQAAVAPKTVDKQVSKPSTNTSGLDLGTIDSPGKANSPQSGKSIKEVVIEGRKPTNSSSEVMKMQQQLIALYNDIAKKPEIAHMGSADSSSSIDGFLHLLLNRYTTKPQTTKAKSLPNFSASLETLSELSSGTKAKADGIWGPFTNTAINAAASIMSGVSQIYKRLGKESADINKDLQTLKKLIPSSAKDFTEKEKNNRAEIITAIVYKFRQIVNDFLTMVSEEGAKYQDYISKNKKFNVLQDLDKSKLNPKETSALEDLTKTNQGVPFVFVPKDLAKPSEEQINIKYSDISRIENFKQFLESNDIKINNVPSWEGDNWKQVANFIRQQIVKSKSNQVPSVRK